MRIERVIAQALRRLPFHEWDRAGRGAKGHGLSVRYKDHDLSIKSRGEEGSVEGKLDVHSV